MPDSAPTSKPTRRTFLGGVTAATWAVHAASPTKVIADVPSDQVRLALVGAGGRGGGAIVDSLTVNSNVRVVAITDFDRNKAARLRDGLVKRFDDAVDISDADIYDGLDGYRRVLDRDDIDAVLFATPPGFRPGHIGEAIEAGVHVFAEKPVCVDPIGYRACVAADDLARRRKRSIVTGTQYRRQANYIEAIGRIHDGAIGEITSATSRFCTNGIWYRSRRDGMTDTEYQIHNWYHFPWLSGDQIVEQAVHNIDTLNWIMRSPPESAFAVGGQFTRPADSQIWDSMSVDYEYPGNRLVSMICRQIPGASSANETVVYGTKGRAIIYGVNAGAKFFSPDGKETWSMDGDIGEAYRLEHKDLVDSIRSGQPIVELRETAESSLTAVLGRTAAYTGQTVDWDFIANESKLQLFPDVVDLDRAVETSLAIPGKTKLV